MKFEREKSLWREILETYRELKFLWDPKDKNYQNKPKRAEGYEMLFQKYLEIDSEATIAIFKKRLDNMRTAYKRENRKVKNAMENGDSEYTPTLWYYDWFSFLDDIAMDDSSQTIIVKNENQEKFRFNFNRIKNKIFLEKDSSNGLKRKRESSSTPREERRQGHISTEPVQSSDEDASQPQPSQPKRRIYQLLQKQEKFIDTASRLLKQENDWEVIGKAIGLQLRSLEGTQKTIAQKLISDTIFYGNLGKLTLDSFVNVESFDQKSEKSEVEITDDHIVYVEQPPSPSYC